MFLLGFRRKLTALALCKSIESAIQWFQIHHRITFATMQNPAVARVIIFSTLVPRLIVLQACCYTLYPLTYGGFCRLLTAFANSLDPDQDRQNVDPNLDAVRYF